MKQKSAISYFLPFQLHPTSFVDPKAPYEVQKFLCPEVVRGSGALLLNVKGERFVNELERRDAVSQAINQNGAGPEEWNIVEPGQTTTGYENNKIALLLMNQNIRST